MRMCIARWEKDKRSHIGHRVAVAQGWYERSGPGAAGTIQLFHIISARPSEQPLTWYVPFQGYTRGLGWRIHCGVEATESSTNKQHILSTVVQPSFGTELGRSFGRRKLKSLMS
jgi:hypothetical protein